MVERDLVNLEAFTPPHDNYHITCLYMGGKTEKLNKKQDNIYRNWTEGVKQSIAVEFILYVPNHILTAFTPQIGEA